MHTLNVLVAASRECQAVGHLCSAVSSDAPLRLAYLCDSPEEAASKAGELKPDVCVLDLRICGEDGFAWIPRLHACCGAPVVVIDAVAGSALKALDASAADFSLIPSGESESDDRLFAADALERIKAACTGSMENARSNVRAKRAVHLLVICCEEGGPAPAAYLLKNLPANGPAVIILQRNPVAFSNDYAGMLSGMCGRAVRTANNETRLEPGHFYFADVEYHPEIKKSVNGILLRFASRPKADGTDAFLSTVASALGDEAACVLLSEGCRGMRGLAKVAKKGGLAVKFNKNGILREIGNPPPGGIEELPLEDIASVLASSL